MRNSQKITLTPLADPFSTIRMEVASALGNVGKQGVELLVKILKDEEENKDIRLAAVFGLQSTVGAAEKAAIEPLVELLEDKNHWIRAAAVLILSTKTHDKRAEEAWRQTVDNELVDSVTSQRFDDDYFEMLEKGA